MGQGGISQGFQVAEPVLGPLPPVPERCHSPENRTALETWPGCGPEPGHVAGVRSPVGLLHDSAYDPNWTDANRRVATYLPSAQQHRRYKPVDWLDGGRRTSRHET